MLVGRSQARIATASLAIGSTCKQRGEIRFRSEADFTNRGAIDIDHQHIIKNQPMTSNLLWLRLDEIGLPWRMPRSSLIERYGVKPHAAYSWNVIEIETAPSFVEGLLWPLSTQVFPQFSSSVPATEFSGITYVGPDARENFRKTTEQLSPHFGEGVRTDASNTLGRKWEIGPASIQLTAWPEDMQRWPTTNPSHVREPRLKVGCHMAISTGLQLQATTEERSLIESFRSIVRILDEWPQVPPYLSLPQSELEYVRQFESDFSHCSGWAGISADKSTLIFKNRWLYIVPVNDIVEIQVRRTLRGKGPGGSVLSVICRYDAPALKSKALVLSTANGPDDLNESASCMARAIDKPLELLPYDYDV